MIRHHSWIGPFLYGFAWTIVAPAILLWWAVATSGVVTLPALHAPVPGWILVVAGLALMAVGMAALAIYGCGLPMNAYPPPRYVVQGIYGWISHSFYVGFILFAFGLSTAYGSASGLWLVTPSAALALPLVGVSAGGSETASPVLWITGAFLCATPLLVRRRPVLRRFAVTGLIGLSAAAMVYLVAPTAPLVFPLFCVLLAADAWWSTGRLWGVAGAAWAAVVAGDVSLRQGISPAGVLLTAALFLVTMNYDALWHGIRRGAEWLANSWREWRIGPVRIIKHGFYAGLGGAVGFWIAGRLAGPGYVWPLMLVGVTSLLGAMLWGQYVEGSPMLLRPLGWYGGMVGGLAGIGALRLLGVPVLPLLGALAVAIPWIQALGRFRCLVQGCCHGTCAPPEVGIRYYHPRSRVVQIAGWEGVPLHPTPLYSIAANVVLGVLLYRLWVSGVPVGLVVGLYFIFSGAARFVEESYRGEPQTPVAAGLRLYQWLALISFAVGIPFTTISASPPAPAPASAGLFAGALLTGLIGWFVTGVDFPGSNRRFSRLAPAD